MALPIAKVEVAFGTAPLTVPGTWTDITTYVRSIQTRRGRDHELRNSQAGECQIVLDNSDRRFDPTYTSSPYYPNVVPMRQVRVTATHNSVTYPLFYGYVEDWAQTWPNRPRASVGDAECTVRAVDGFKLLSMYQLANSYPTEVLTDNPFVYWPMDSASGQLQERGYGNPYPDLSFFTGPWMGVSSGSTPGSYGNTPGPLVGGGPCARVTSGGTGCFYSDNYWISSTNATDFTFEFWVKPTSVATGNYVGGINTDAGSAQLILYMVAGGQLRLDTTGTLGSGQVTGTNSVLTAGVWQHVVVQSRQSPSQVEFYINGVNTDTVSHGYSMYGHTTSSQRFYIGGYHYSTATGLLGDYAHAALYFGSMSGSGGTAILPAERVAKHAAATVGRIPAGLAGAQIGNHLDAMGWPSGLRALDTGATYMQAYDPTGSTLQHLLVVAEDSERGLFQMGADGDVVFHDRNAVLSTTGSHGVSQATFGDGGGAEEPYADLQLRYDDADLFSRVTVARDGGTAQTAETAAAVSSYGPRTLDVRGGRSFTDADANAVAHYLLDCYRSPEVRPVSVKMRLAHDVSMNAAVLGRDTHHDRVTVARRPPGAGSAISLPAHVEGISWNIAPASLWEADLSLVPEPGVTFVSDECLGGTPAVVGVNATHAFGWAVTALTTGTTIVSSTFGPPSSPAPHYLFVVSVKGTTPDIPTITGTNGFNTTWTQRGTWLSASGLRRVTLFTAISSSTVNGTITATFGGTQTGGAMYWSAGGAATATEVPAQIVHSTGTGTAMSSTLVAPAATSTSIGFFSTASTSGTFTAGTGFNPNSDVTAARGLLAYERRTSNDSVALVDGTQSVSSAWQAVAVEVASLNPGSAGSPPTLTGMTTPTSGTGAYVAAASANWGPDHPGIAELYTGSTTTGRVGIIGTTDAITLGTSELFYVSTLGFDALSTAGETYTARAGLGDSSSGESVDFVGFRYTHGTNGGRWEGVCRSNSVETARDTGRLMNVTGFQWELSFVVNAAGTSVQFYINGIATGAAVTTNIPTGASRKLTYLPGLMIKSAGTSGRKMLVDRYNYVQG